MGVILVLLLSGLYTFVMLNVAGTKGVYDTPETGMRSILDRYYSPDRKIRIIYAGTNSFDGSDPHIWYVIYEVRASSHADGSPLHKNVLRLGRPFLPEHPERLGTGVRGGHSRSSWASGCASSERQARDNPPRPRNGDPVHPPIFAVIIMQPGRNSLIMKKGPSADRSAEGLLFWKDGWKGQRAALTSTSLARTATRRR